jgi:hypothetical protein
MNHQLELELFTHQNLKPYIQTRKLYLVPTPDSEFVSGKFNINLEDQDFAAQPSFLEDLPNVDEWVQRFVLGLIEIWGGKRSPMQLARWSQRTVHKKLMAQISKFSSPPKLRKIYINQPIEGVIESTVTIRINDRVKSLLLRFEGVDKRWICTELEIVGI